jgi:hypothetical protein
MTPVKISAPNPKQKNKNSKSGEVSANFIMISENPIKNPINIKGIAESAPR